MKINKVYKFGVIPKSHLKEMNDIIWINHKYYNDLVQLKRGEQIYWENLYDLGLEDLIAEKESAYQEYNSINDTISDDRIKSRSKKDDKDVVKEKSISKKKMEFANKAYFAAVKLNQKGISKEEKDRVKALSLSMERSIRSYYSDKYNLYWGTYNLTTAAVDAAEQSIYKTRNGRKGLIHFKSFDGTGRFGVQIQNATASPKNRSLSSIFSDTSEYKTLISITKTNAPEYKKGERGHGKRSQHNGTLKFRIGSGAKGVPIFAAFDIKLHREFPPDAILKAAVINKRRFGSKIEWSLDLTIEYEEIKPQVKNGKVIAFDIGWRNVGDDIKRIAAWKDSDNNSGIITQDIGALNKADDIKSILDDQFNLMKGMLSSYIKSNVVPEWLSAYKYVDKYKSYSKLIKLFNVWRSNRFDCDNEMFECFHYWKRKNVHLANWEAGARRSFLRQRKQQYLTIAKDASEKYETVVFENLKLDNMAKGKVAGGNRQQCAPSVFKGAFTYRFDKNNIVDIDAKNTSKTCNSCGSIEELDSSITTHTCSNCNVSFDRDINAASNILKRGVERVWSLRAVA